MGAPSAMATVEPPQNPSDNAPAIDPDPRPSSYRRSSLCCSRSWASSPSSRCWANDFVAWDDPDNFLDNIGFRGLGWNNIRWAWGTMIIGVYQPIAWMILEFEYLFTKLDQYGYHLGSALMHGINAAMLYYMSLAIAERCRPDLSESDRRRLLLALAFSVAIFIVHPMRTEVIAWASAQPYLPCAFFSMLSVITYLKANPPGGGPIRSRWLLLTFVLYAAGDPLEGGGDPHGGRLPDPRRLSAQADRPGEGMEGRGESENCPSTRRCSSCSVRCS